MKGLKALAEQFRAAGAKDPEAWATSELEEGIPQLARFLFLRGAWRSMVKDGDAKWIEACRRPPKDPNAPLAGLSAALNRLLERGADPRDLTEVVRCMQYEVMFALCYQLSDPSVAVEGLEDPPEVNWALFELDAKGRPGRMIDSLHESALETDPTGREMRPGPDRKP